MINSETERVVNLSELKMYVNGYFSLCPFTQAYCADRFRY